MSYMLSQRSLNNLIGVHPALTQVVRLAIRRTRQDFFVNEGIRTKERQKELYAQGRTAPGDIVTDTLNSRHFIQADGFGHAVDIYPHPFKNNDDKAKFDAISKAMFEAAKELRVAIRWGADWDRDGKPRERGESDSPHWEV